MPATPSPRANSLRLRASTDSPLQESSDQRQQTAGSHHSHHQDLRTNARPDSPPGRLPEPASRTSVSSSTSETAFRHIAESFLCLAIAVIVFRSFVLEGYIISTGSMAPTLLGYHKRIECPDCGFRFPVGVAFDDGSSETSQAVRCPNCLQTQIDASNVPRNSGDQLLVFKEAFAFRDPARWEIAVFLNPTDPTQAYVKRTIGRPGETVQIRDGDVFINSRRARKPYRIQRSIRIPVFDDSHHPHLDSTFTRWLAEPGWRHASGQFSFSPAERSPDTAAGLHNDFAWTRYFHLNRPPARIRTALPESSEATIAAGGGSTDDSGTIPMPGPVTDVYGYNTPSRARQETRVHDLMLSCQLAFPEQRGQFAAIIRNRRHYAAFRLDRESRNAAVWISSRSAEHATWLMETDRRPVKAAVLAREVFESPVELDVSTFDRQLTVGANGTELLSVDLDLPVPEPVPAVPDRPSADRTILLTSAEATDTDGMTPDQADAAGETVLFGARGGTVDVTELRLYRDVHYTAYDYRHGVREQVQLADDEFFFLGDNSPVSLDSRGWQQPAVARHLIVGRPLVVHLPSRPGELHVGGHARSIRLPDFSRMRFVR